MNSREDLENAVGWAEARSRLMMLMRLAHNTRRGNLLGRRGTDRRYRSGGLRLPPGLDGHQVEIDLRCARAELAFCERGIEGFAEIVGEAVARQVMREAVAVLCR